MRRRSGASGRDVGNSDSCKSTGCCPFNVMTEPGKIAGSFLVAIITRVAPSGGLASEDGKIGYFPWP